MHTASVLEEKLVTYFFIKQTIYVMNLIYTLVRSLHCRLRSYPGFCSTKNRTPCNFWVIRFCCLHYKQLLHEVFVVSRIIKVEVRVISQSRRLGLITLTETLIILDSTKTESNNCFLIHSRKKKWLRQWVELIIYLSTCKHTDQQPLIYKPKHWQYVTFLYFMSPCLQLFFRCLAQSTKQT